MDYFKPQPFLDLSTGGSYISGMKKPFPVGISIATLCASLPLLYALTGCSLFGPNPSGPTKTESYLFDVITNLVPRQVFKTNIVDVPVTVYVLKTNEQNEVHQLTNTVIIKQVELVTATNWVENYNWTPKTNTVYYTQAAGTIGNAVIPGSGGLITGLLTAGLLAWSKLRSSKKTNINLAQGTETLLELLQMLPNGDSHVLAAKQMLQKTQAQDGVSKEVQNVLSTEVSRGDAKASATEIQSNVARSKS